MLGVPWVQVHPDNQNISIHAVGINMDKNLDTLVAILTAVQHARNLGIDVRDKKLVRYKSTVGLITQQDHISLEYLCLAGACRHENGILVSGKATTLFLEEIEEIAAS